MPHESFYIHNNNNNSGWCHMKTLSGAYGALTERKIILCISHPARGLYVVAKTNCFLHFSTLVHSN